MKDCTDICICRRRHITCVEKYCPKIGNEQCPPHTVPIYQDKDISYLGVTCKCKGRISSTAWKTCFNRIALPESTRSFFVVSRDLKIQRRRRPPKRRLKREFPFFQSSSRLLTHFPRAEFLRSITKFRNKTKKNSSSLVYVLYKRRSRAVTTMKSTKMC